jgi:hypothetical protein
VPRLRALSAVPKLGVTSRAVLRDALDALDERAGLADI